MKRRWLLLATAVSACQTAVPTPAPVVEAPPPPVEPPPPVAKRPPPKVQVAQLGAFTPLRTSQIFGEPSHERWEGDTRLMQFSNGRCVVDMVFNAAARLVHVEARALATGTPIDTQACLDTFPQTLDTPQS